MKKKITFLLFIVVLSFMQVLHAQLRPDLILAACKDNQSVVIMNFEDYTLSCLNIKTETGSKFKIDEITSGKYSNISVLNDSLVLLSGKYIYNFRNGQKIIEFSSPVFTTPSGKRIFQLVGTGIYEIDFAGNKGTKILELAPKTGSPIQNLIKINENTSHLAAACSFYGKSNISIDVYETSTGKLIQQIDGYKEDDEKKGLHFIDISANGNQLVAGNQKAVKLFEMKKGKTVGEFEEVPVNNRKNFIQAGFRADGNAVFISSWYKIYTLNTTKFEADENIVVSNNIHTTKWKDQYGYTTKERTTITTDYFWSTYAATPDGKYIMGIMDGLSKSSYVLCYMYLGDGGIGNKRIVLK